MSVQTMEKINTSENDFRTCLGKVVDGRDLSTFEAELCFKQIFDGNISDALVAAFLTALRMKGEDTNELTGAVLAARANILKMPDAPSGAIDVCGTGGDGQKTLNVSTAVAFILAALGIPVAKHGNRALSSRSGAMDVLAALGIPVCADLGLLSQQLHDYGVTFLAAPVHNKGLAHVTHIRQELGMRTIFNLMGPLCNPAEVRRQLVGVYDSAWLQPLIHTFRSLGAERVWAICGRTDEGKGVDELTLSGINEIVAWQDGEIFSFHLTAAQAGLPKAPISAIAGGSPAENALALEELLKGKDGFYRHTVLLNAAIALHVAGEGNLLEKGIINQNVLRSLIEKAAQAIDSGAAYKILDALRRR